MKSIYRFTLALLIALPTAGIGQAAPTRPFGTLREQAETQQRWLASRMATVLPAIMRKYAVEMWVIPMREYNEDPVFTSIVSPTTFAARRRTIYVFTRRGDSVERVALGGSSQGGVYTAIRSTKAASEPVGGTTQRNAELWGDEQWQALKKVIEERNPRNIAINVSRVTAFSDGLSAGEMEGMREALGEKWTSRFVRHDGLALDLIATRLPDEAAFYRKMQELVWAIIDTAFSARVITPGVTRTDDVVWWFRQRVNDLGLGSWFQPSVSIQRRGVLDDNLGPNPVIQRGDVLHCDFGIVALRLATDTQHMGYVLRDGETAPPAGLVAALRKGNQLQDIVMEEVKPGRTGNEVLRSSLARMRAAGIDGTVYTHPIGTHGHGAGPLIGLWDYQEGVPGRGDTKIIPSMWFSIELQATSPVPEWNGQRVRMALEEDMTIDAAGQNSWALRRQTGFHLVRARPRDSIRSLLRTVDIQSGSIETVYSADRHFEAPNWSPDGRFFIVNSKGRLYRLPARGEQRLEEIPTGFATRANNDHGISPDGRYLVLSHHAKEHIADPAQDWLASSIYIVPITGGSTPVKVTTKAPSFWHGWSPDGKTLAFVGRRNDEWDIYAIPVEGGEERRLTTCRGLDDGPDYSSDGKFIYYNSFCSGSMQIWRMNSDGSKPEQLTRDAYSNWFPHPSPDGRWVVFISYLEDQGEGHPFGKQVKLRLMDIRDGSVRDLTQPFFGGQGTINVPSWSPDSRRVAFVVYEID